MAAKTGEKPQETTWDVGRGEKMKIALLITVLLTSSVTAFVVTLPLRRKVEALESMVEMLSKAVRGKYDEGK